MTDISSTEEMNRLASTLTESLASLRETARQETAEVDAGASTALVARTLGEFFAVAGGLVTDVQHQANEVPQARTVYERTDDAAADSLPPPPLPLSPLNGGN